MRNLLTIICCFICLSNIQSQNIKDNKFQSINIEHEYNPNIVGDVIISGSFNESMKLRSGTMFLYEIKGNDNYILDSVPVGKNGFSFNERFLNAGVYRIAYNNKTNTLDFVINPKETSSLLIEINNNRIKTNYNIPNSLENKIKKLYDKKEQSVTSKLKLIRKSTKSRDQKITEMTVLQQELYDFGDNLNNQHSGTYFGMILSHMKSENEFVPHLYFNDINFNDQSIIRSKLLPTRIQSYIQKYNDIKNNKYGFHDAIDLIMDYAKANEVVAEFCMYNMLDGFYNTGQTSGDVMWESLCNYIMDEYIFGEGCGDDINPSDLLKERANQFKNLQIGKVPTNFSIADINGKNINLKTLCKNNKYTVLMFWASHCNHCMEELPGFASWYNKNKTLDIEIVGVSLDANKNKWESTVSSNSFNWINICEFEVYKSPICQDYKIKKTPTFFVLNRNMEIVLKPKSTHQLRSFLTSNFSNVGRDSMNK